MSQYQIVANYLEHSGGTKFYETIQISDITSKTTVLMKRYGSIASKGVGGGQIIPMFASFTTCDDEREKIIKDKMRRKKDGQYYHATAPFSLNIHTSGVSNPDPAGVVTVSADRLMTLVKDHYPADHAKAIITRFDLENPADELNEPDYNIIDEQPEDDTPRDASWGAW
jgi:hypothetical protein